MERRVFPVTRGQQRCRPTSAVSRPDSYVQHSPMNSGPARRPTRNCKWKSSVVEYTSTKAQKRKRLWCCWICAATKLSSVAIETVVGNSKFLQCLRISTGPQKAPPADPVLQPLGDDCVVLNVLCQSLVRKPLPFIRNVLSREFHVVFFFAAA